MPFFQRRPHITAAIQWTGDNLPEMRQHVAHPDYFRLREPDGAEGEVFDRLHETWVVVNVGDWVMVGPLGENYPCRHDVFKVNYEEISG